MGGREGVEAHLRAERPKLRAQRGGAAGLGLKPFHPAATEHAGSAIQGIPSFIWGLPLALPHERGSSLGSKLPGLCSAAEGALLPQLGALAPASMAGCSTVQGIPLCFGDSP